MPRLQSRRFCPAWASTLHWSVRLAPRWQSGSSRRARPGPTTRAHRTERLGRRARPRFVLHPGGGCESSISGRRDPGPDQYRKRSLQAAIVRDETCPVEAFRSKIQSCPMARWPSNDRSGTWRSSARDAPGVARALNRLGKRVRALRLERKLTQEQAAEIAKLDEKHWQDIEGARTNPTVATLVGIARALKVTVSKLFEVDDEK